MKTPKILLALLCLVFGGAVSASAVTADFAGFCTLDYPSSTTADCAFSALQDTAEADPSSCPGSLINRIDWNFGDGTPDVQDDSYVTYSYPDAINTGSVSVTVKITCADNSTAQTSRHVVFVTLGCYRCINMNNGWD